ncbi:MAG: beta-N-acetylhexosaminidase [Desulfatitalea sp. BRH_c12]|nr:MAG: beta-N-acetylhexosaminidase [Desulfatitalea sp. BRH_c12]
MQAHDLSEHQQIGQRLMIGFDSTHLDDALRYAIDTLKVGGLILFSRNIASPDQVRELCHAAQTYAAQCGQPRLFIAIDQEGGIVARLKPPFTQFDGNPALRSVDDAIAFARTTARELAQIGVNMNMAPVLDIAPSGQPSVMEKRVFAGDPHCVARMGCAVIEHLQSNGIMAVGKHFPGIGRTVLDSHADLPELGIAPEVLSGSDLIPFQAAVQASVCGIMLSHIRYTLIDPRWPASLSTAIAHDWLRLKIGYNGLVLTDDLDMGAIVNHYGITDIVPQCMRAAVDILLICHAGPRIEAAFNAMLHVSRTSPAMLQSNAAAVQRILDAKARFC